MKNDSLERKYIRLDALQKAYPEEEHKKTFELARLLLPKFDDGWRIYCSEDFAEFYIEFCQTNADGTTNFVRVMVLP